MNVIVVGGGKVGRKLVEDFNYEGGEKLHLLMVDNHIPAGAKLY